jgi:outer membrane protein OmpA-like peptidoglycan-associated protein
MSVANGCATKSYVRKQVAELETRVNVDQAEIRSDVAETGAAAENSRMMALGHVDYKTAEQFAVTFDYDSAELTDDAQMTLDQVNSAVQAHPNYMVDLLGHTCTIGPDSYNEELSRRRANAVLHYLVQHGQGPVGRYAIVGLGESMPVVASGSEEDLSASRRVEIHLLERVEAGSAGSKSVISQSDEAPR